MVVPASCRRSGRCHECIVEILRGGDALTPPDEQEMFLRRGYRLACRATVAREPAESDLEFIVLRRRLKILMPPSGPPLEVDPAINVRDGRVRWHDEDVDGERERLLGIALDVGTTTVVLQVLDLRTGEALAVGAFENPQRFGGSDVMSRISYERDHPGALRQALRRALNGALKEVYAEAAIDRHCVYEAMVVANSTMRDLFFGLDVAPIGHMPYKSITELAVSRGEAESTWLTRLAHELGIFMNPHGRVTGAPLVASHVGGDVAADLVSTELARQSGTTMLVDIGTNTEIIVSDGQRILAASSPAGPAFEGGLLRYGMPGADGAIEKVRIEDGGFAIEVIGDVEPQGICGSGLVDILAELRRADWMTPIGRFTGGRDEFTIASEPRITFSRADASQLAQAKASNASGQRILLRRLGLHPQQVDRVLLAGGFANAIDIGNAIAIGFLADVRQDRVERVGNAALHGAVMLLLSRGRRAELGDLVGRIEHVELETEPDFFGLFVEGCQFSPIPAV